MVLQEEAFRNRRMKSELVHALAKLGILLTGRQKLRAHAHVAHVPVLPAIVCAINAGGRNSNVHALRVCRIEKNRMQAKPATTRLPLRTVRMIVKSFNERPGFAGIIRSK